MNSQFCTICKTAIAVVFCLPVIFLPAISSAAASDVASSAKAGPSAGFGSLIDPRQEKDAIIATSKSQKHSISGEPTGSGAGDENRRYSPRPAVPAAAPTVNHNNSSSIPDEVNCNLFENPEFSSVMEALKSLKSSINSAQNCKDEESNASLKEVEKNRSQIEGSLSEIHTYFEKTRQGEKITPEIAAKISSTISETVSSSAEITGIFSKNFECTKEKSPHVALAVNNLLNGLTPFAAMAASAAGATVSSSAAFPLLAGTAITATISSINDILTADQINIKDPVVRRAIFENTCQLLKLEKKKAIFMNETSESDHLISSISDDSTLLNEEARRMYGLKIEALGALNEKFLSLNNLLDSSQKLQRDSSKYYDFFTSSPSDKEKCLIAKDILDSKIAVRTFANLKSSLELFSEANENYNVLVMTAERQVNINSTKSTEFAQFQSKATNRITSAEFQSCATDMQVWLQAIKEAANIATEILTLEKNTLDTQIQWNKEYMSYVDSSKKIKFRANVARGIVSAVEEIKKSNSFNKTELYSDLEKLRNTLFYEHTNRYYINVDSPVTAWLNFYIAEHQRLLENFYYGFHKIVMLSSPYALNQIKLDTELTGLKPQFFSDENAKMTTAQVCTELKNVQSKWYESEAYLLSAKRFCTMISSHINLSNENDDSVVKICKGQPLMTKQVSVGLHRPEIIFSGVRLTDNEKSSKVDALIESLQQPKSKVITYLNLLQDKLDLFACGQ